MSLYLDASVVTPTAVEDRFTEAVGAFLVNCGEDLVISEFAAAEVASLCPGWSEWASLRPLKRRSDWRTRRLAGR